jgi:hypothetical protein
MPDIAGKMSTWYVSLEGQRVSKFYNLEEVKIRIPVFL